MAGYQRCISLAVVCLLLCHDSLAAENDVPESTACTDHGGEKATNKDFKKKHVIAGTPTTLEAKEWESFLKENGRHIEVQSFLSPSIEQEVERVCNGDGLKYRSTNVKLRSRTNLCISKNKFDFVNVYKDGKVENLSKKLILACELEGNKCLPTHFQPNPEDGQNKVGGPCNPKA